MTEKRAKETPLCMHEKVLFLSEEDPVINIM